jgi:hypothetical protein
VVLDLSGCEFLDAAVLGVIVGAHRQLGANGQELVVQGAVGQVERLMELSTAISSEVRLNRAGTTPSTVRPGTSAGFPGLAAPAQNRARRTVPSRR